jgi:4-hydroxybenzoate polyprenyltransferase
MTQPLAVNEKPLSRIRLFLALSRTPHGLLDMATPLFCALVWLGGFPSIEVGLIGLLTVFSGYTAVYALNDVIDYRFDKDKMLQDRESAASEGYLDSILIRHPLAQSLLSYREAVMWTLGWAVLALLGAYLLNPWCMAIFLGAGLLEIGYCLLWNVSPSRSIVSGGVKTSGPVAAVLAVDPSPSPLFLALLFVLFFSWEIGGQNIPADWTDMETDRRFGAKTIPVRFGPGPAGKLAFAALGLSVLLSPAVFLTSGLNPSTPLIGLVLAIGLWHLLLPGWKLQARRGRDQAMALFNRASSYPLSLLAVVLLAIALRHLGLS